LLLEDLPPQYQLSLPIIGKLVDFWSFKTRKVIWKRFVKVGKSEWKWHKNNNDMWPASSSLLKS
jgi:hypothetical protein